MEKQTLGGLLRESAGLRTADNLKSADGVDHRIVVTSPHTGIALIAGHNAVVNITSVGGVDIIEASAISDVVDLAVKVVGTLIKIATGQCDTVVQVHIHVDQDHPENTTMTTEVTGFVCPD